MSKPNESASTQNPTEEPERSSQQEAAQPTIYQADYHANEESRIPGSYIVGFHLGHTIAKHFAFLGREFDLTALDEGYFADEIDDDLFNAVRRDPGVKRIEDDCLGVPVGEGEICESLAREPQATTSDYQAPYYPYEQHRVPGIYIVAFHPDHTIAKHFALLGRQFELTSLNEGYFADMDDELFHAVRRDPGVGFIEDNVRGLRVGSGEICESLGTTSVYQAPYYPYEQHRVSGVYMVAFYPDHTVPKHLAFLGREFELTGLNEGYFADMDNELFNAVRRDPGVRFIEDDVSGGRDAESAQHAQPTVHQAEYYPFPQDRVPGAYVVEFHLGHTIAKHFLFLSREFELTTLDQGYYADLDDDLFSAVRRDPGVRYLEDDILGVPFGSDET